MRRNRVLLISNDVVGEEMAGPGIRYWELARVLSRYAEVTLAVPGSPTRSGPHVRLVSYTYQSPKILDDLVAEHDILVTDPFGFSHLSSIPPHIFYVADVYDPFPLENLELYRERSPDERNWIYHNDVDLIEPVLHRGDFFLCASERQRDFWLGTLLLAGRLSPALYDEDPTLERLIAVVPCGLPSTPPRATAPFLKGVHPAVAEDDMLIVWGGGIWNWLDPLTLLHALARVVNDYPHVKLVFPGTRHPNAIVPEMATHRAAVQLAGELGLLDSHVFFGEWAPYEERANYLLEADIGITLHRRHVETRMAFRTRVLDYLWAGLPIIASDGDATADLVREWGLGITVRPEDVEDLTRALVEMVQLSAPRAHYAHALRRAAQHFTWENVTAPLVAYCQAPYQTTNLSLSWPPRKELTLALSEARREATMWHELVIAYERGKFIRAMRWLHDSITTCRHRVGNLLSITDRRGRKDEQHDTNTTM